MSKTRLLAPQPPRKPTSPIEWERLARQAIEHAELAQDSRAQAIRNALNAGNADRMLKRLGIIGEIDLKREFPSREK